MARSCARTAGSSGSERAPYNFTAAYSAGRVTGRTTAGGSMRA